MARSLLVGVLMIFMSFWATAQSFEVFGLQESYKGAIGDVIKAPLGLKNTTDKSITLVVRKISEQIGRTQKNFFCIGANCLDQKVEDFVIRIEPGQVFEGFQIGLEGGLVPGVSSVKYVAFNKSTPGHSLEFEINFSVEEKLKENIYQSKHIQLHDVYPNPAIDHAFVNYKVLDDRIIAKIRVHNLLGNVVGEYDLGHAENFVRIRTEDLTSGIYFYTLYVDNESVMTRKLIVRK
jgi:hypothetical protein